MGRVGFEPTITGARDQYLRPSCPHWWVDWTTAPDASLNSMIQNALVRRLIGSGALAHAKLWTLRTSLELLTNSLDGLGVTGRIQLDVLSWKEIALFRLLAVRWGLLASVEVGPYQTFEEDTESPCPTIVHLVNF